MCVHVHVSIHVCEDVLVSPTLVSKPEDDFSILLYSYSLSFLGGTVSFFLDPKRAVSGRMPVSPRDLLVFTLQCCQIQLLCVGSADLNSGPAACTVIT